MFLQRTALLYELSKWTLACVIGIPSFQDNVWPYPPKDGSKISCRAGEDDARDNH
jgi:hypothetical protein